MIHTRKAAIKNSRLAQGDFKKIRDSLWIQIGCYQPFLVLEKISLIIHTLKLYYLKDNDRN